MMMTSTADGEGGLPVDCPQNGRATSKPQSQFLHEKKIAGGEWMSLHEYTYKDPTGRERTWEAVHRTTRLDGSADGVVIIGTLRRVLKYDCIILVQQYRPPLKTYTIEFPAGLIDPGETPEQTAVRELKEETGYTCSVKHISPATAIDPGSENCTTHLVTVEIDGDSSANLKPQVNPQGPEFIEVLQVPVEEFLPRLNELSEAGVVVDSRVYSYAVALTQATKERKQTMDMK